MRERRTGRRMLPGAAAILAAAVPVLSAAPAADRAAVMEQLAALPWGGPLCWLPRAALVLAGGIL